MSTDIDGVNVSICKNVSLLSIFKYIRGAVDFQKHSVVLSLAIVRHHITMWHSTTATFHACSSCACVDYMLRINCSGSLNNVTLRCAFSSFFGSFQNDIRCSSFFCMLPSMTTALWRSMPPRRISSNQECVNFKLSASFSSQAITGFAHGPRSNHG